MADFSPKYSPFFWILFFCLTVAVTGCSTPGQQRSAISVIPLPQYSAGHTYIYSDGSWERVTAADAAGVSWVDHLGNISNGSPDFTYRRAFWLSDTRRGERRFNRREDIAFSSPGSLWPLAVGNTASYLETGRWIEENGTVHTYQSNWVCRVEGIDQVEVLAGKFETWKIQCDRFNAPRGKRRLMLQEIKTWHYSPGVGHWVLATSRNADGKQTRRQELLAMLPPSQNLGRIVNSRIDSSFQQALELNARNEAVSWQISGSDISGTITAGDIFQIPDGTYCRQYEQRLHLADRLHTFYGMACRETGGNWVIPRRQ